MATLLKQSTAVTLRVGPFLDKTDGVTEETALTPTFELSKAGGAFAARNDATAPAHDSNGWYSCVLNATDTATLGRLVLKSDDAATHLPVWHEFLVVPANVYDSLVAGSDALQVHANEITAGLITAAAIATGAIDADAIAADAITAAKIATGAIDADALAADAVTEIQNGLATAAALATAATNLAAIQADTDDIQTRLPAALVGGRMNADVGNLQDGVITAAKLAADAITAAKIAADAITEIQSGLATAAALQTVDDLVDDLETRLTAARATNLDNLDVLLSSRLAAADYYVRRGTAQAGGASSITLDAGAPAVAHLYRFQLVSIIGGTGVGQTRFITAYDANRIADVTPAWTTVPDATSVFLILPWGSVDVARWLSAEPQALSGGYVQAVLLAALANSINAASLDPDVTTELQAGLATAAALQVVDDLVDDLESRLTAQRAANLDSLDRAISAIMTTAMAESYNADGAAPTPAQALFVIMQRLTEFSIAGTTITMKRLDGSTTAFTLTLDDASNPTSSARAT